MLQIHLNDLLVGELARTKSGGTEFHFLQSYLDRTDRPALSQSFLDRLPETFSGGMSRLPSFFRNLLPDPDGRHREHVARELGIKPHQEYAMLARLGADLPGAVRAISDGDAEDAALQDDSPPVMSAGSLAGMQPKFSSVRDGASLRWRVSGRQSDLITKPPDAELPGIPENEFSIMRWASACGLAVADVELIPVTKLVDIPDWLTQRNGNALIVKRFDRTDKGRIHIEDMAQAWGLEPDEKYEKRHYLATACRRSPGSDFV